MTTIRKSAAQPGTDRAPVQNSTSVRREKLDPNQVQSIADRIRNHAWNTGSKRPG